MAELSLSRQLRANGRAAWEAAVGHPMVREITAGSLPRERFRHYFEQNIAYLEDYTRALGAITAKAPDVAALEVLGAALNQIVTVELPANRQFLKRLGGDPDRAGGIATMEPVTYAYTRHLLAAAALGDCAVGIAAALPCQWSYGEIGAAVVGSKPEEPIYADWIEIFGDPDYGRLVEATTELFDRLAGVDPNRDEPIGRLRAVFEASTRYEVQFWDMAYSEGPPP